MASEHVVGVRDSIIYSLWPRVAATRTAIKHIDSHKKKGYPADHYLPDIGSGR
jgi:hypothetical protein